MSGIGPSPRAAVYNAAYHGVPNWDIGRPQRAFVYLVEADLVRNPVLDVGCGTGELTIYLARQGYDLLGIDIAPRAIAQARTKARWRRVRANFLVANALEVRELRRAGFAFSTVVDSGLFHLFSDRERDRFIDGLGDLLVPGGAYFLLGDARTDARSEYGIAPAELRRRFSRADGWDLAFVIETVFERRYSRNPAYFAGIIRE